MSLLVLATLLPMMAFAQGPKRRDAHVIFKDGFRIEGKIEEQVKDLIFDSASGRAFPILSGQFKLDDHVRDITFSPMNVQKVLQLKIGEVKEPMQIQRFKFFSQRHDLLKNWEYFGFTDWAGAGDRTLNVRTPQSTTKTIVMKQRIGLYTPQYLYAITDDYKWSLMYFTSEFKPKEIRSMLLAVFDEKKDLKGVKAAEKYLQIAAFLHEAGWYKEAETELANIIMNYPEDKAALKSAEQILGTLKLGRANAFVDSIKKAADVGQPQVAIDRLEDHARLRYDKVVSPAYRTIVSDLTADYAKAKTDLEAARKFLKELPAYTAKKDRPQWTKAAEFILDELNLDTIMPPEKGKKPRLELFLRFAEQYETQRAARCKPTNTAEEVLALAISGWLQDGQVAETNTTTALKLVQAREFFLEYLKTDSDSKRTGLLSAFKLENDISSKTPDKGLPIDVLARLLRMIPPAAAHDTINTKVQTIKINVPNSNGGTYLVQLPPDYHHLRPYPVVMVLHGRDPADETLERFSAEAAKQGFILVAPLWAGKGLNRATWRYSKKEHDLVLDTLRDLRRRFQVDSDRVFMFGSDEGAKGAIDVGLSHPDQFAGVVPMHGNLTPFAKLFYWTNAQYLPFYVIEGERNGPNAKQMQELFVEWTKPPFASMYVQYRGRSSEWFSPEIPLTMDWMSRKKRHAPMKELGQAKLDRGLDQEFRSSRESDNRFYWLSSEGILERSLMDPTSNPWPAQYKPATFQASLTVGNKSKKDGKDDIWNQVYIRVAGMKQVTFWITPEMNLNFELDLLVFVNGNKAFRRRIPPSLDTLVEELYQSGDRQRLYLAKVEIRM